MTGSRHFLRFAHFPNQLSCFDCWSLLASLLVTLDRLRLTTIYRDRTIPNETFIYLILSCTKFLWNIMEDTKHPKLVNLTLHPQMSMLLSRKNRSRYPGKIDFQIVQQISNKSSFSMSDIPIDWISRFSELYRNSTIMRNTQSNRNLLSSLRCWFIFDLQNTFSLIRFC